MNELVFRGVGAVVVALVGWALGPVVDRSALIAQPVPWSLVLSGVGGLVGLAIGPYISIRPYRWAQKTLQGVPQQRLLTGTLGLVAGLIIGALLAYPLSLLPGLWGELLPVLVSLVLGYTGMSVVASAEVGLARSLGSLVSSNGDSRRRSYPWTGQIVVDTSAIIDGRIADMSQTGFIPGTLVIPRFVLDELRHIADSPDSMRRNRGRRGLDMLNKLQKESEVPVRISDADFEEIPEVDSKLVHLARQLQSPILTTDFNLNRVAELQGVRVLNVNELSNALKAVVLPGEEMLVRIIQEGKEAGQGVAFLDDGTMIVVEGGKRYLNNRLEIVVTRVLQTVSGRMIFAHPKTD